MNATKQVRKIRILNTWVVTLLMSMPCFLITNHCKANTHSPTHVNKVKIEESYLFVQSASEALIKLNQDNTYTITLKNIPAFITYFTDRPSRKAGTFAIDKFLSFWELKMTDGFKANPPNAVLHAIQVGTMTDDIIFNFPVELTNPVYDKAHMTLTYTAKSLSSNAVSLPLDGHLKHVTLFIDDACLSCWGQ